MAFKQRCLNNEIKFQCNEINCKYLAGYGDKPVISSVCSSASGILHTVHMTMLNKTNSSLNNQTDKPTN